MHGDCKLSSYTWLQLSLSQWEDHLQMYTMFAENCPTLHLRESFFKIFPMGGGSHPPFPYSPRTMRSAHHSEPLRGKFFTQILAAYFLDGTWYSKTNWQPCLLQSRWFHTSPSPLTRDFATLHSLLLFVPQVFPRLLLLSSLSSAFHCFRGRFLAVYRDVTLTSLNYPIIVIFEVKRRVVC